MNIVRAFARIGGTGLGSASAQDTGGRPRFVEREIDEHLRCGRLEYGRPKLLPRDQRNMTA